MQSKRGISGKFVYGCSFVLYFYVPYTDASNMSSCNKTELDILEDGHGIPLAIAKKLAENKFHVLQSSHLL